MRRVVLEAFPSSITALTAFREASARMTFAQLSFGSRMSVESAEEVRFFRRVTSREDLWGISGLQLTEVRWHYRPSEEVRSAVASRVRSPQHA